VLRSAPTTPYSSKCDRWKQWVKDRRAATAKRAKLDPIAAQLERTITEKRMTAHA
jgi:hypothetical protein